MRGHLAALIPWWATDFGEADIARVSAAIRDKHISQGPVTRELEERLADILGVPYVVCTSSGTTALTMALLAAGIGHGDEVIVPNRTWIATAHAVLMTGAKVRLVDVDARGLMSHESLNDMGGKTSELSGAENNLRDVSELSTRTSHTAAARAVPGADIHSHMPLNWHDLVLLGVNPDVWAGARAYSEHGKHDNISEADDSWDHRNLSSEPLFHYNMAIPVHLNGRFAYVPRGAIEDSCQAFPYSPRGLAACYSMSTAKLLPTGQGGFVATRDEALYKELKALRTHDVEDAMVPRVLKWRRFGYNFRYNDVLASIGLAQLETLNLRIERLQEIRSLYNAGLPSYLELLPCDGVPLYTEVLYADSERLRAYLLDHGIQARPNYPSLNTAPYLNDSRRFPNSERFERGLTLPSGPAQTGENIRRTLECLHEYRN